MTARANATARTNEELEKEKKRRHKAEEEATEANERAREAEAKVLSLAPLLEKPIAVNLFPSGGVTLLDPYQRQSFLIKGSRFECQYGHTRLHTPRRRVPFAQNPIIIQACPRFA